MTVFNPKKVDYSREYMFFGEPLNTQRFDKFKFPKFNQLTEQMLSFFWRPQEVNLQKDISDYKKLSKHEQFIFQENLKFQTLLDSIVGRSPLLSYLPCVSIPELENAITTWGFFEAAIHSRSYSYIIQNLYPDPSVIFDDIVLNQQIVARTSYITDIYDDFIAGLTAYRIGEISSPEDVYELKKKLFLSIVATNMLEGIRFYVSFACSFAFGENKLMEGNAKILSLIARDENLHLALTSNIINNWREGKDDPDFVHIFNETQEQVLGMFDIVIEQEKDWASYLFKDGSIIGLNEMLLHQYVDHMAQKRAVTIGYKLNMPTNVKNNPLPWTQHWFNSHSLQVAPQEAEIENYSVGAIKQDINDQTFDGFQL